MADVETTALEAPLTVDEREPKSTKATPEETETQARHLEDNSQSRDLEECRENITTVSAAPQPDEQTGRMSYHYVKVRLKIS